MKTYKLNNFRLQAEAAEKWRDQTHQKLIDEGFEWDGMDGYSFTCPLTDEQIRAWFEKRKEDNVR